MCQALRGTEMEAGALAWRSLRRVRDVSAELLSGPEGGGGVQEEGRMCWKMGSIQAEWELGRERSASVQGKETDPRQPRVRCLWKSDL